MIKNILNVIKSIHWKWVIYSQSIKNNLVLYQENVDLVQKNHYDNDLNDQK